MSDWKNSLYAQIAYMAGMAFAFLFAPNFLLGLLGLEPTSEVWIRLLGLIVCVLCAYYWVAIRHNLLAFAKASVWVRFGFCASLTVLALWWNLLVFIPLALLEAGLAVWTHRTLRGMN